jgi:hypothetical protein
MLTQRRDLVDSRLTAVIPGGVRDRVIIVWQGLAADDRSGFVDRLRSAEPSGTVHYWSTLGVRKDLSAVSNLDRDDRAYCSLRFVAMKPRSRTDLYVRKLGDPNRVFWLKITSKIEANDLLQGR